MPTKYFVLFCILLAVPLLCLVGVVAYCCFKVGIAAGMISLAVLLLVASAVIMAIILRAKKRK